MVWGLPASRWFRRAFPSSPTTLQPRQPSLSPSRMPGSLLLGSPLPGTPSLLFSSNGSFAVLGLGSHVACAERCGWPRLKKLPRSTLSLSYHPPHSFLWTLLKGYFSWSLTRFARLGSLLAFALWVRRPHPSLSLPFPRNAQNCVLQRHLLEDWRVFWRKAGNEGSQWPFGRLRNPDSALGLGDTVCAPLAARSSQPGVGEWAKTEAAVRRLERPSARPSRPDVLGSVSLSPSVCDPCLRQGASLAPQSFLMCAPGYVFKWLLHTVELGSR